MSHLKQKLSDDIKAAMLSKDALRLETLRGLKSVILYEEVAKGKRDVGLEDDAILQLLAKESKKRVESAELYIRGGAEARAQKELAEKEIIDSYLPEQLTDSALQEIVDRVFTELQPEGMQQMGIAISRVKAEVGNTADGAKIAKFVKEKLQ
jgi:uncharacterized protein